MHYLSSPFTYPFKIPFSLFLSQHACLAEERKRERERETPIERTLRAKEKAQLAEINPRPLLPPEE